MNSLPTLPPLSPSSRLPMDFSIPSFFSSHSHIIFTVFAFLVPALIFYFFLKSESRKLNLPPGPPGWPVVGNLFQFARSGKSFVDYVKDLQPKYGPIFTLKMGKRNLIIVSDAKLIHEALVERGPLFASRPPESATRNVFSCNKFTVNASLYGPLWRTLRRNMVQNMLSSSRIREFSSVREKAMDKFIDKLRTEAEANNGVVWVLKNARFAVFCILLVMCFGIEMDEETTEKMDQLMKTVLITISPRLDDYLPVLSPFFSKQKKKALELRKEQMRFIVPFIEQRRKARQHPGPDTSFSYLDTLFNLKTEGRTSTPSNAELVTLCSEFLNGGTDTTATAVEWGIAQLIANPEIQTKLYGEICQTVGKQKVRGKDVDNMPYLNAFLKELLRKHPPVAFTLTHAVTEPTQLAGYDVPTNANVDFYIPAVSEDKNLWSNPEKFDPERFLSGKEDADLTGITGVKMVPFGVGRRICPGLGMANLHVSLMIARMVQEFEWKPYPANSELDFTEKFEFTMVMKNPLRAVIKPRV